MVSLDGLFSTPQLNQEQIQVETIVTEMASILAEFAGESKKGRNFTCDDVADLLRDKRQYFATEPRMTEVLDLFAETLEQAQHSINRSIPDAIEALLKTDMRSAVREIFTRIREEEQLYNWIKTTSV